MNTITPHKSWPPGVENLRNTLSGIFFFFMPFTQALTFDVGFPLKISELALVALSFRYIFFNKRIKIPGSIIVILLSFFLIVLLSTIVNLFWQYPYHLRAYPARFGYKTDSIARFIYFAFATLSFLVSLELFFTDTKKYISIWIYGALTAAAYSWYLVIFSLLKLPVFLLPGMQDPPQTIAGGIIRCGTFLEGNYIGLFLVISAAMSFYIKKYKTALFLLLSVITSFAILSVFSAVLVLIICCWRFIIARKNRVTVISAAIFATLLLIGFSRTSFFTIYVKEKLYSINHQPGKLSEGSFSKIDRLATLKTTVNTALANPVLGVGLANFARHYDHFYEQGNLTDSLYQVLRRANSKVIPNNIYTEIWSETGSISLLIFIIFLTFLLKYTKTDKSNALFMALISMIICFNAYPSFIMIYLWAFMALPVAHYMKATRKTAFESAMIISKNTG